MTIMRAVTIVDDDLSPAVGQTVVCCMSQMKAVKMIDPLPLLKLILCSIPNMKSCMKSHIK